MIYIITILFTISFVFYQKYQFTSSPKWHALSVVMRILTFIPFFFSPPAFKHIFLAGTINIILYEILINVIALEKDAFYVGFTSWVDKTFKIHKWTVMGILLLTSIIYLIKC